MGSKCACISERPCPNTWGVGPPGGKDRRDTLEHVHQRALAELQAEHIGERALQPLIGKELVRFEIQRQRMDPMPCAAAGKGAAVVSPHVAQRHCNRRWRLTTGLTSGRSISSYSPPPRRTHPRQMAAHSGDNASGDGLREHRAFRPERGRAPYGRAWRRQAANPPASPSCPSMAASKRCAMPCPGAASSAPD